MGYFENKKFTVTAISVLVILNLILIGLITTHQFKSGEHRRGDDDRRSAFLSKRLGFTDNQTQEYELLRKDHRAEKKAIQEQIDEKRREVFQLTRTQQASSVVADSLTDQIGTLVAEMELRTFEYFIDVREICTPEQLQRLDSLVQNMIRSRNSGDDDRKGPPRN